MRKRAAEIPEILDPEHVDDRQFIASLYKGLEVLKSLAHVNRPLGNKELAEMTGLPKATVSRITYTLASLRYLRYLDDVGKYVLGFPVLGLGYACLAGLNFAEAAKPLMKKLADSTNTMVALGSRDQFSMLYAAVRHPRGPVTLQLNTGSRISLARSSMGRAYLSALDGPERTALMAALAKHTGNRWPKFEKQIGVALEEIEEVGFCTNVGQWYPEVNSVGVPYIPPDGSPAMAFSCGAVDYVMDEKRARNEIGPRLLELVGRIRAT